jgi:hypothetical protein
MEWWGNEIVHIWKGVYDYGGDSAKGSGSAEKSCLLGEKQGIIYTYIPLPAPLNAKKKSVFCFACACIIFPIDGCDVLLARNVLRVRNNSCSLR